MRLVATKTPEYGQKDIRASPTQKMAQLGYIYTNACSMHSKQEELEATVKLKNYDTVANMETCWDDSHSWSAVMDGY